MPQKQVTQSRKAPHASPLTHHFSYLESYVGRLSLKASDSLRKLLPPISPQTACASSYLLKAHHLTRRPLAPQPEAHHGTNFSTRP